MPPSSPSFDLSAHDLPDAELPGLSEVETPLPEKLSCDVCIDVRRNLSICCAKHPITLEQNPDTGCCPHLDIETGDCAIYYGRPDVCRDYFCPEHVSHSDDGKFHLTVL